METNPTTREWDLKEELMDEIAKEEEEEPEEEIVTWAPTTDPFSKEEGPAELTILGEAIEAAKKAFEDSLHKYVIDTRCYRFSAKVEFRDLTFTTNLGKLIYEDLS